MAPGMRRILVFIAVFSCVLHLVTATGEVNGFISFGVSHIAVEEDTGVQFTAVQIPFTRTGGTVGNVITTFQVVNSSAVADFLNVNSNVFFSGGVTTANGVLIVQNDAIPEGNETFLLQINEARLGAEIGPVSTMLLTIIASDDPYGEFQFNQTYLQVTAEEPLNGVQYQAMIEVIRGPGVFGSVSVQYQVVSGPSLGLNDISPTTGQLDFANGERSRFIAISILPDDLPENDEVFTIRMSNPAGGATLASSGTESQLTVSANDSPIRFADAITQVDENAGAVVLTVYRGLLPNDIPVGPLNSIATVQYSTSPGTASAGSDFQTSSGTVTFSLGSTTAQISVPIINDTIPEGEETFTVTLNNPSSDSVLSNPQTTVVTIAVNDDAGGVVRFKSTTPVIISEDAGTEATLIIERMLGTVNDVSIAWSIQDTQGNLATTDFSPVSGTVTIPDGQTEASLTIRALNDAIPEQAEQFIVSIDAVIGGNGKLDEETLRIAPLYVEDSDDVYGLIQLGAGSTSIIVNPPQRTFTFQVARTGGAVGQIMVDYSIVYLPPGVDNLAMGSRGEVIMDGGSVTMPAGQSLTTVTVTLFTTAFIETGAQLYVEINSTEISGGVVPLLNTTNSPRIGALSSSSELFTVAASSGYIRFANNSQTVITMEPDSGVSTLELTVERTGSFGDANLIWSINAVTATFVPTQDVIIQSGTISINQGQTSTSLEILVAADDFPELDETFVVTLLSVSNANQRLSTNERVSSVTISSNDNPEGVFSISDSTQGPFFINETDSDFVTIVIDREGGSLTLEQIQFRVIPSNTGDFNVPIGALSFAPGETIKTFLMVPVLDNIPETNETFTLEIFSPLGKTEILGSRTNVSITILPNDDYNGVFSFGSSSLFLAIDEPLNPGSSGSVQSVANFIIERAAGSFGPATVYWLVDSAVNVSADISPLQGSVQFADSAVTGSFQISALPDLITESNISYAVRLDSIDGGGRLDDSDIDSTLTVRENDDPIFFSNIFFSPQEGDTITLNIFRGGQRQGSVVVSFAVTYQTASQDDVIISPISTIILADGQQLGQITVVVVDDATPELVENLEIRLISVTGDAVVSSTNNLAIIAIEPSDEPNGVFQFAGDTDLITTEGTNLELRVNRTFGRFDTVMVEWQVFLYNSTDDSLQSIPSQQDFTAVAGVLQFGPNVSERSIQLDLLRDGVPELEEEFVVRLIRTTGGTPGARLGSPTTINLTVPENDDPYGMFRFTPTSERVDIGEDIPSGDPSNGTGTFFIQRSGGTFNTISVIWEALPSSTPALPVMTDLLLMGDFGTDVQTATPRPNTGTRAVRFTGSSSSIVTVPEEFQPLTNSDFAISMWVNLVSGSSGMLVAKASANGATRYYSFAISADGSSYILQFFYLPSTLTAGFSTVEVTVPQSTLQPNQWYSVILNIANGQLRLYVDGAVISTRTLASSTLTDEPGVLTVGGLSSQLFFTGSVQDVRVYHQSLSQQEITTISADSAASDITPISGIEVFPVGIALASFTVSSVDDSIPEPSELFTLSLVATSFRATTDSQGSNATLTVLKSDSSNGVFGFTEATLFSTTSEGNGVSLLIDRTIGMFSSVDVAWEVRSLSGTIEGPIATDDFSPSSGVLTFDPNEAVKTLVLLVLNENVPEVTTNYTVKLLSVTPDDGYISTTPTSGASIDSSRSAATVTVPENDFPYGVLQLATSPPIVGVPFTPQATSAPVLDVMESAGTITIYIVRAQGLIGTVRTELITEDGSAISGMDYLSAAAELVFAEGERFKTMQLQILDDSLPELEKQFSVNLTNPTGNPQPPVLRIASTMVINILPSDDALGVFGFADESQSVVVSEATGGMTVSLTIDRSEGALGPVEVYWRVDGPTTDITPSSGVVMFGVGQTEGTISLTVTDDMTPELLEVFDVILTNASGVARIDSTSSTAVVSISANDYPYGLFTFSSAFRPLVVDETAGNVTVTVTREFGTTGTVTVDYMTLSPSPSDNIATADMDFESDSGTLTFGPNETTVSFTLLILDDDIPELAETIYVVLDNPTLVGEIPMGQGPDVAPGISPNDNATIIIAENDDARGVIEFTSASFNGSEGDSSFIHMRRSGGTFGEVRVVWQALPNTATSSDFIPLNGIDSIPAGSSISPVTLLILDDILPEFTEEFSIQLVAVEGGARLGTITSASVSILPSDDPNGAFVFSTTSLVQDVNEPEGGIGLPVTLLVQRNGGSTGVSQVDWSISRSDGSPVAADIQPTSGNIQFVTGLISRSITLTVLPDDVPEITEVYLVNLTSASGGARIGDQMSAQVRVLPNDIPYGTVSLQLESISFSEDPNGDRQYNVPVIRSDGTFNDLLLTYNVRQSNVQNLDNFAIPVPNVSPPSSTRVITFSSFLTTDHTNECATVCVQAAAICNSFAITTSSPPVCEIFNANITGAGSVARTGVQYYEARPGELEGVLQRLATPLADFGFVTGGNITIPAGSSTAAIPVTILHDDIPELSENFTVTLQSVTALGEVSSDPDDLPRLGANTATTVIIAENDDPYGRFVIYYGSREQEPRIPEPQGGSLAVMLTVEREAGLVGNVQVTWSASGVTASSEDFSGTGAVLDFAEGEFRKTITVFVNSDDIPEADETIRVTLSNPTQGAVVAPSNDSTVTIIIEANDNAAGIFGFAPNSRAAVISEGSNLTLLVERSVGQIGDVMVYWSITDLTDMGSGPDSLANDFEAVSGSISFTDGQSQADVVLVVLADKLPEIAELFTLRLEQAMPLSSNIGMAVLDPLGTTATLTVQASDNPHGVVQFQPESATLSTDETDQGSLTIIRTFGTIGAIRVTYQAGETAPLPNVLMATPDMDFNSTVLTVDILDTQPSTTIPLPVIDDSIPELAEVFSIKILSAHLISNPSTVVPLGNLTESIVTILPSDNPQGLFNFPLDRVNITEDFGTFNVPVLRDAGTFGAVSVLYLISRTSTDSSDFSATLSGVLAYAAGESVRNIPINVFDDNVPEIDEEFCVQLFTPTGGAELGVVNETCITILGNDDPHGVFRFDMSSLEVAVDEAGDTVTNDNIAVLTVLRERGTFGAVIVPFTVQPTGQIDLVSSMPIVTFAAGQNTASIMLTAVQDSFPELSEAFSVILGEPVGGGRLNSSVSPAEVTIRENQDPFGVLEITTANGQSSISVEEDSVSLSLIVRRSSPSFDTITVVVATVNDTASSGEDFGAILTMLTFAPNETQQAITVLINNDNIPEIDETFTVALQSPSGGSRVGEDGAVSITILTNDEAHGQIRFAQASLSVVVAEGETNTEVNLQCLRDAGSFGVVRVTWSSVGDHGVGEVFPSSGEVEFLSGQSVATLTLTVLADTTPELNEVTRVTLTGISENGVPSGGDQSRGATIITGQATSFVTVTANDAPHGVVSWAVNTTNTTELEGIDSMIELVIVREFGTIGDIIISYMTMVDSSLPVDERATSDQDFVGVSSTVTIPANASSVSVNITVRHDDTPELTESFSVVLTDVELVNEADRMGSPSNSPRIATNQESTVINILENDDSRGTLHVVTTMVSVEEADGTACVTLNRTGGTFGTIGAIFSTTPGTATGGGVDYSPDMGTVQLQSGMLTQCLPISIVNDITPESEESFMVTLTGSLGGAQLGSPLSATVTILQNDDLNGVFSFAPGSLVVIIPENSVATLFVERSKSAVGPVTVYWEISSDGVNDLSPANGSITFQDGETQASFTISAIDEGVPELYEAFTVSLVSVTNGGRISSPSSASVAIPASQGPTGVVGFAPYQLETVVVQEGASFTASIVRSSGMFGIIVVQWALMPADSTTFPLTTGTEVMADGQLTLNTTIQTTQDSIPEVARQYTFQLVSAGEATIDATRSQLTVVVAASDSPHGIVNFLPPFSRTVSEDAGSMAITVLRSAGLVGELAVNFSVILSNAETPEDFIVSNNTVYIADGEASGSIIATIVADSIPEEDESFRVRLDSVELVNDINGGRDFTFAGDASEIDSVPQLGPNTEAVVVIQKNDDANGVISLTQSQYTAAEGDVVAIQVTRSGGTFGSVAVSFTVTPGTAQGSGVDYSPPASPLVIPAGQSSAVISIPIVDDTVPEFQESFGLTLNSVSGGARLSGLGMTNVIINASDSPTGRLRFSAADIAGHIIDNPTTTNAIVILTVERQGGTNGIVSVSWQVDGPNPGSELTDITAASRQGTLTLQNGQSSGTITITFLPSTGPEPVEVFTVRLNTPTNSATIDSDGAVSQITVRQEGMPYGVIGFFGESLNVQEVSEADIVQTVTLPISRTQGNLGEVEVSFVVTAASGESASLDISPANGTVTILSAQQFSSINIQILPDVLPESAELFTVTITSLSAGMLDTTRNTAQFRIQASDSPYGLFGVRDPSLALQSVGSTLNRALTFTISRDFGSVSSVMVVVNISYAQDPGSAIFETPLTRTLTDGQTSQSVTVSGSSAGYLAPGDNITISITSVTLIGSSVGIEGAPEVSAAFGTAQLIISSTVANPNIGFAANSLQASVSSDVDFSNNVMLTVNRQGLTGSIMIRWFTGAQLAGAVNGSITPATGSVTSTDGQTTSTLTFSVVPTDPPTSAQVFAVGLEAVSQSSLEARVQSSAGIAYIEPQGVVKLTFPEYSGLEGFNASITVTRLYGSQGNIQVFGVASQIPSQNVSAGKIAAIPGTDFGTEVTSVVIPSGSISGNILIPLSQNFVESQLKVFSFRLTSVTRLGQQGTFISPRLSNVNLESIVTIIDDEAGAGQFGFSTQNITAAEGSSPISIVITRIGANVGSVTLQLSVTEGRRDGSEAATAGADYDTSILPMLVTFNDQESQRTVQINIVDDSTPELAEYFTVHLANPQGGSALINPTQSTLEVMILPSDSPYGVFSFADTTLTIAEQQTLTGTLTINRVFTFQQTVTLDVFIDSTGTSVLEPYVETVTFGPSETQKTITLTLVAGQVPAPQAVFTVRLSSAQSGISLINNEATVSAIASTTSVYSFSENSREVVTDQSTITLTIVRTGGLQFSSAIQYTTLNNTSPITVGDITFQPAVRSIHYLPITASTTAFNKNQATSTIVITIYPNQASAPSAFYVSLQSDTSGILQDFNALIVITQADQPNLRDLYRSYFAIYPTASPQLLVNVSTSLEASLRANIAISSSPLMSEALLNNVKQIVTLSTTTTGVLGIPALRSSLTNIFDLIIPSTNHSRRSDYVQLMKTFAYGLLEGKTCSSTDNNREVIRADNYYLEVVWLPLASVGSRSFFSVVGREFVSFPSTGLSGIQGLEECVNISYIEFNSANLFSTPVLNSKVLSVGIQGLSTELQSPVVYRIYADNNVLPSRNDCLIWQYTPSPASWDSSICDTRTSVFEQDYVECECRRLGDFAAFIPPGYGWTLPAPIVCAIVLFFIILVIGLHLLYIRQILIAAQILLIIFTGLGLFELVSLVDIFATPGTNDAGCIVMGLALQLITLLLFMWILGLMLAFWVKLMNFTKGKEPIVAYIVICCVCTAIAIITVICTILICLYGVQLEWTQIYGRIGDICFMPRVEVAALSTALPILVVVMLVIMLLIHSCISWSRWEDFKSLYEDSYNKRDVPLVLGFFGLIFITVLFGGLHMYLQTVYFFTLFVIFNIILGLYVIVVYLFISLYTLTWKHTHDPLKEDLEPATLPEEELDDYPSTYESETSRSLVGFEKKSRNESRNTREAEEEEEDDDEPANDSLSGSSGEYNFVPPGQDNDEEEGDEETSEMDDLMFALRTGTSYSQEDMQPLFDMGESRKKPSSSEQLQLRRISIADTHV